ncbi:hypothetical protein C2E23DRAFT_844304 [Lenzites betulinus]|nr:hypothetical protein C2E23DRAFT_844304 [Lenzites betulinus]
MSMLDNKIRDQRQKNVHKPGDENHASPVLRTIVGCAARCLPIPCMTLALDRRPRDFV